MTEVCDRGATVRGVGRTGRESESIGRQAKACPTGVLEGNVLEGRVGDFSAAPARPERMPDDR